MPESRNGITVSFLLSGSKKWKAGKDRVTRSSFYVYAPVHILHNKNDIIPLAFFGLCRTTKPATDNDAKQNERGCKRRHTYTDKKEYLFPYVQCVWLPLFRRHFKCKGNGFYTQIDVIAALCLWRFFCIH